MTLLQYSAIMLARIPCILLADVYPRRLAALFAFLAFLGALLLAGAAIISLLFMARREEEVSE